MQTASPFRISREREVLEIEVGPRSSRTMRKFVLEEQSNEEVEEYLDMQDSLVRQSIRELVAANESPTQTAAAKHMLKNSYPLVAMLLQYPVEGEEELERVTAEWVRRNLGPQGASAVLERQDKLNSVEAILGNGSRLLIAVEEAERQNLFGPSGRASTDSEGSSPDLTT